MERYEAIGCIETFGLVFVLEAADAMCKAADVELIGYENVASGYISVIVQGDVGACRTAVDAGVKAVENMGAEVYSCGDPKTASGSGQDRYPLQSDQSFASGRVNKRQKGAVK